MIKDISELKEGQVMNNILHRRFVESNQNFLGVTTGKTGSGKTYWDLKACESWYKFMFGLDFPIDNVCFTPEEAMNRIVNANLQPGEIIILEEAGTSMGNLDFQNKISRLFNYVIQSFRNKRIGLLMNLPYFTMLNKTTRMLCHMLFSTIKIDKSEKKVLCKAFHLQVNQENGKVYKHKPKIMIDGVYESIDYISYGLPSDKLISLYEQKKSAFVNKLSQDVLNDMQEQSDGRKNRPLTENQLKILQCWKEGIIKNGEISEKLGLHPVVISNNERWLKNKGYNKENPL